MQPSDTIDKVIIKNNFLNLNGIKYFKDIFFYNLNLDIVRDLWMLSFYLMGISIEQLIQIKKEKILEHIIILNINDTEIAFPLNKEARDIFHKYPGQFFGLNIIEKNFIPSKDEISSKANKMFFNLNNDISFIQKYLKLDCILDFGKIYINWSFIAKELKLNEILIAKMIDFNSNKHSCKNILGNIEKLNELNQIIIDNLNNKIIDDLKKQTYPIKQPNGNILLYED